MIGADQKLAGVVYSNTGVGDEDGGLSEATVMKVVDAEKLTCLHSNVRACITPDGSFCQLVFEYSNCGPIIAKAPPCEDSCTYPPMRDQHGTFPDNPRLLAITTVG